MFLEDAARATQHCGAQPNISRSFALAARSQVFSDHLYIWYTNATIEILAIQWNHDFRLYYDQVQLDAKAPSQCGAQPARRQCGEGSHCQKGINSKNNNSDIKGESATTTITTAAAPHVAARGTGADGGSEWAS